MSKKDHLFEKIFAVFKELLSSIIFELVYLLSCKGYAICKLRKITIIDKYLRIFNFKEGVLFAYKNWAINI